MGVGNSNLGHKKIVIGHTKRQSVLKKVIAESNPKEKRRAYIENRLNNRPAGLISFQEISRRNKELNQSKGEADRVRGIFSLNFQSHFFRSPYFDDASKAECRDEPRE